MSYKLRSEGHRRNGVGEITATISLVDAETGDKLFSDTLNLTIAKRRAEFAADLVKRFSGLKGRDVEGQLFELLRALPETPETPDEKPTQGQILVALAREKCQFFHDGDTAFVAIDRDAHKEIWPIRSLNYKRWLGKVYWDTQGGKVANSDALQSALNVLEGFGTFDGPGIPLHNRVAWQEGALWYDLSNETWQAVRVTSTGWDIVDNPPILFQRFQHQLPQVLPLRGGDPQALLPFLRPRDDDEACLLLAYVGSCFIPDIPHVIPVLHGTQGSGKTSWLRFIRRVVDPSRTEILSLPDEPREMIQLLSHHWVAYFDNLSHLSDKVSDILCRASTGEGFTKRMLFQDDDDKIYSFRRCVGLNGINIVANKADLLDRGLVLSLKDMLPAEIQEEKQLRANFVKELPGILGGFFDLLRRALAIMPEVHLAEKPRMADFAIWGVALARSLGYTEAQFIRVYQQNRAAQNQVALEASLVAPALLEFMQDKQSWEGKPRELLTELDRVAEAMRINTKSQKWPKEPSWLGRRLNEVRINLAREGILFSATKPGDRHVVLSRVGENSVHAAGGRETDMTSDRTAFGENGVKMPPNAVQNDATGGKMTSRAENAVLSNSLSADGKDGILPSLTEEGSEENSAVDWVLPDGREVSRRDLLTRWEALERPPVPLGPGRVVERLNLWLAQADLDLRELTVVVGWIESEEKKRAR